MEDHDDELDNLKLGEKFLPAQIGPSRLEGGQKVVGIHDGVYERVQEGKDGRISARCKFNKEPNSNGYTEMMEHMEATNLTILLAQHKTNCIYKFHYAR